MSLTVDELVGLFSGDDWSYGYPTAELAFQLCLVLEPARFEDLWRRVYPGAPLSEVCREDLSVLRVGYRRWRKHVRGLGDGEVDGAAG